MSDGSITVAKGGSDDSTQTNYACIHSAKHVSDTCSGEKRGANAVTSLVNVNRRAIIIPLKLLARDEFHGEEAETFLGWQNLHSLKSTTVTLDSKVFR